jgi:hypothetical protein
MKRGRKSRAELEMTDSVIVDVSQRIPPPPPSELNDAQAQVWRDAVASMPGNWLQRGAHALLVEYTRHVCRSRLLEQQIALFDTEWIRADGGLERFDRLLGMAERETKALTACARALRLTPQAQMHPRSAGRLINNLPSGVESPWSGAKLWTSES